MLIEKMWTWMDGEKLEKLLYTSYNLLKFFLWTTITCENDYPYAKMILGYSSKTATGHEFIRLSGVSSLGFSNNLVNKTITITNFETEAFTNFSYLSLTKYTDHPDWHSDTKKEIDIWTCKYQNWARRRVLSTTELGPARRPVVLYTTDLGPARRRIVLSTPELGSVRLLSHPQNLKDLIQLGNYNKSKRVKEFEIQTSNVDMRWIKLTIELPFLLRLWFCHGFLKLNKVWG